MYSAYYIPYIYILLLCCIGVPTTTTTAGSHSHVVNMDFIEFYGPYPDVYLSPADQQGNRIIKND